MGLLRFIAIFILVYYLFKLFMRYVAPYLLKLFIKKAQKKMMQDMGQEPPSSPKKKKEGQINVEFVPDKKKSAKKDDMGDYVDFEDVKE